MGVTNHAGLPGTAGFSVLKLGMSLENRTGWWPDRHEIRPGVALLCGFSDVILFMNWMSLCAGIHHCNASSVPVCEDTFVCPVADGPLSCLQPEARRRAAATGVPIQVFGWTDGRLPLNFKTLVTLAAFA